MEQTVALTPEVTEEIITQYKRTRSPFKAAKAAGVTPAEAWAVIDANKDRMGSFEERYGGQGRPELRDWAVATRRATDREWDNADPAIVEARARYEAGTHDMATGRDGQHLILYSIPLRWPTTPRPGYFTPESN